MTVISSLKKIGYRAATVNSAAELERAIAQGGWDLVIADLSDSPAIRGRLTQSTTAPRVHDWYQPAVRALERF